MFLLLHDTIASMSLDYLLSCLSDLVNQILHIGIIGPFNAILIELMNNIVLDFFELKVNLLKYIRSYIFHVVFFIRQAQRLYRLFYLFQMHDLFLFNYSLKFFIFHFLFAFWLTKMIFKRSLWTVWTHIAVNVWLPIVNWFILLF